MNASPADQRRLLEVADLDTRIRQADAARRNPPQAARVQELLAQPPGARRRSSRPASASRDDLRAELARIESDVAVVDARRARDAERLALDEQHRRKRRASRASSASLARRKSDLEDAELEVMERLEAGRRRGRRAGGADRRDQRRGLDC